MQCLIRRSRGCNLKEREWLILHGGLQSKGCNAFFFPINFYEIAIHVPTTAPSFCKTVSWFPQQMDQHMESLCTFTLFCGYLCIYSSCPSPHSAMLWEFMFSGPRHGPLRNALLSCWAAAHYLKCFAEYSYCGHFSWDAAFCSALYLFLCLLDQRRLYLELRVDVFIVRKQRPVLIIDLG